jgi:hypothetical protein
MKCISNYNNSIRKYHKEKLYFSRCLKIFLQKLIGQIPQVKRKKDIINMTQSSINIKKDSLYQLKNIN